MNTNYRYEVKYLDRYGNHLAVEVVVASDDHRLAERMVEEQSVFNTLDGSVFLTMTACEPGIKEDTLTVLQEGEPD